MERRLTVRIVAAALLAFCLLAMVACAGSPSAANNPAPGPSLATGSSTSQSTSSQPAVSTAGAPSTVATGPPEAVEPDTGPWKDLHPTGGGTPLDGGFQSVNAVYDYRIGRVVLFGVGLSAEQSMDFGTPFTFDRVAMFDGLSSRLSDTGSGGYYLLTVSGRSVVYDTADNRHFRGAPGTHARRWRLTGVGVCGTGQLGGSRWSDV